MSETADLLASLTDAEKVALTAGADIWTTVAIPRLGIPSVRLGDGPHGVRKPTDGSEQSMFDSHPATCFPSAASLGATWDPMLLREVGHAIGREAAAHEVAVLLGPGVNLKRSPVGGRNFEYFSEDPLLTSRLGGAWVGGVQNTGVGASLKHFVANDTEKRRYGIDAIVDERALRELYLACFERIVIDEQPETVMAAYNKLNGLHCTEHAELLNGILRGEWGFRGLVVSDWGAAWDRTLSIPAGNDLAMPGLGRRDDRYVLRATRTGLLPKDELDAAAARILDLVMRHADPTVPLAPDLNAQHALARRASAAGTVLLANDGTLPLAAGTRVALIGAFAKDPRYQGAGSSHVVPTRLETLHGALVEVLGTESVAYASGYDPVHDAYTLAQLTEAKEIAAAADVAVVVVGLPETFETEGVDRGHMRLPSAHNNLVAAVRGVNPRTVVVLQNGSPVEMPWRRHVSAIVEGYLGGQAGGRALADVLLGIAEPGGRLAETFPERYDDHPVARLPYGPDAAPYFESLYVGYRWFDSVDVPVAFPFGHGLSYTTFDWSDQTAAVTDNGVTLHLRVTNTGERAGSEVVQAYVHDIESSVYRPEQELGGFAKVELAPGESAEVVIDVDRRAFSFWSTDRHAWVLESGAFEMRIGRSSRDILWRTQVELEGDTAPLLSTAEPAAYRHPSPETGFPAKEFERLLGRSLPTAKDARAGRAAFTLDTAVQDMAGTAAGRVLHRYMGRRAIALLGAPSGKAVSAVVDQVVGQLPIRMFPSLSAGLVGRRAAKRVLRLVNAVTLRSGRKRYSQRW